jgi:hypothetical protein
MNQREIEAFTLRDIAVALVEAKGTGIAPDMEAPPPPPCKTSTTVQTP